MSPIQKGLLVGVLTVITVSVNSSALAQERQRKAIFVIVDGIPADVIQTASVPNLRAIAQQGRYLRAHVGGEKGAYSQTPTISAVGYNSLLTGTWVNKHNVWDNAIKSPNYHYPTIFRLFKTQYPTRTTAVFSSWTDNRTRLLGEGLAQTSHFKLDYHFDGYELDTVRFPQDPEKQYMHRIDEQVVSDAANLIRRQGPDLSWVYLEFTDDMGHRYGDSEPFRAAVEMMDGQIGRLWAAIQYRQQHFPEDWLLLVTTDHGRDEQTGKNHGGQSPRQRNTWLVTNYANVNAYARATQPGIVDIMPTLASFLNVTLPNDVAQELDGTSLIGPVSIMDLAVNYVQDKLDITWQSLEPGETVKIWVTSTNQFETGGTDQYHLLGEVPLGQEWAVVDVSQLPSTFYKVVLEGPANRVNRWVVLEKPKQE
ncbi:alkaline phosphatase family protein [Spirosoma taeanense]|uniref:Alkaline phosphatase family protein n=2 Tax=Spirosoma taeanense TaxID=2735870 RepID=A0A6M5YE93_9BACT|nr:alkaline phosphatase family protein [Spirosoma taeanense]